MKGSIKGKKNMAHDNVLNTISRGTVLKGEITTKGDIRVEGTVVGKITCEAKLVIGEHGSVKGEVDARNAYIAGEVHGEVIVHELLQLQEKGRIEGDIFTQKLSVQVGATFTGRCSMGQDATSMVAESRRRKASKEGKNPLPNGNGGSATPKNVSLVNE